ncbi:unnamed protein product, partial [Iphiclides podalirius]
MSFGDELCSHQRREAGNGGTKTAPIKLAIDQGAAGHGQSAGRDCASGSGMRASHAEGQDNPIDRSWISISEINYAPPEYVENSCRSTEPLFERQNVHYGSKLV